VKPRRGLLLCAQTATGAIPHRAFPALMPAMPIAGRHVGAALLFRVFPHNILFPGIFLAATVLAVNMLGDGLRDMLDPRLRNQL
jgi:ABC-type antimicrobial peptide transport system permease subunit